MRVGKEKSLYSESWQPGKSLEGHRPSPGPGQQEGLRGGGAGNGEGAVSRRHGAHVVGSMSTGP